MKKLLLLVALFFISAKSFSIIFWQPYPIVATLNGSAGHQRMECSVYDSLLGSTQHFNTPYYLDSVLIYSNATGIICFATYSLVSMDNDSTYGYIVYDQELHQFKPVFLYHQDPDYPGAKVGVIDNMVLVYYQCCREDLEWTGYSSFYKSYLYDITSHQWITGPASDAWADGWCSLQISKGAFVSASYNDYHWDPYHWCNFYDPVSRNFPGSGAPSYTFEHNGNQDGYFLFDDVILTISDVGYFSAFDPGLHLWPQFSVEPVANDETFEQNGIIYAAEDDIPSDIAIYDDSTHQWILDHQEHPINYLKIKDRVVTYVDSGYSRIYYEAFSPSQRVWVKDSSLINMLDTIYISEGTVTWVDSSGAHIAGYNDSIGWGNFNTPLQLNFHLTDFYSSTGYPLYYVRDYSIGTDSTWYDFGDGITTSPGVQHSLWHLNKVNGHYTSSASNYNVCIYSNTSAGVQGSCENRVQPCSFSFQVTNACSGSCNGSLSAVPLSGAVPFSYSWSGGSTQSQVSSLCAGTYSITATDNNGCMVQHSMTVTEMSAITSVTPNHCIGGCDGSAMVSPSGGTTGYSFLWSNGDTTGSISNLCAGSYSVTISDSNQCVIVDTVNIANPQIPFVLDSKNVDQPTCPWYQWFIDYLINGGTGPFNVTTIPYAHADTFTIFTGQLNLELQGYQTSGIYTTTITDIFGCSLTFVDTIIAPTALMVNSTTQNPSCAACPDGMIVLNISSGTPPYSINWTPHNGSVSGDSILFLPPDVYQVYVEDFNNCDTSFIDTLISFVGIENSGISEISIFIAPNPASSSFTIHSSLPIQNEEVEIFNLLGKKVGSKLSEVGKKEIIIDVHDLIPGLYFVKVQTEKGSTVQKLIVQ